VLLSACNQSVRDSFGCYCRLRAAVLLGIMIASLCVPNRLLARAGGIASEGCTGCHNGGKPPLVTITPDITTINPGSVVNLTISISPSNGTGAGFFLEASTGKLSVIDPGTRLEGRGVVQNAVRTAASGNIDFKVAWTAPATPGGVDFMAWGNSVNADRSTRGDAEGSGFYTVAFGCSGSTFYHDYDNDGVGAESTGYTIACSVPAYFSARVGDCNDNDPKIFPGSAELCDGKDNNCDGKIDEGITVTSYCTDADGDGHGVLGKATVMGCGVSKGFGVCDNDCNDSDPDVHAGAPEICNNRDDNCNERVDENARVVCGIGWCARYGEGCSSNCTPGEPRAEECNDFDDDCDGVADNGTDEQLCGMPGLRCVAGSCLNDTGGVGGFGGMPIGTGNVGSLGGTNDRGSPWGAGTSSSSPKREPGRGCGITTAHRKGAWPGALACSLLAGLVGWRTRRRSQRPRLRSGSGALRG